MSWLAIAGWFAGALGEDGVHQGARQLLTLTQREQLGNQLRVTALTGLNATCATFDREHPGAWPAQAPSEAVLEMAVDAWTPSVPTEPQSEGDHVLGPLASDLGAQLVEGNVLAAPLQHTFATAFRDAWLDAIEATLAGTDLTGLVELTRHREITGRLGRLEALLEVNRQYMAGSDAASGGGGSSLGSGPLTSAGGRRVVFYSYAHEDRGHLTQLRGAMGEEHSDFDGLEFWADEAIPAAAEWRRTIETKLRSAVCAIVPVSRHLLASEFVMQVELPMLEALGIPVFWYLVSDCPWELHHSFRDHQAVVDPGHTVLALHSDNVAVREQALAGVARALHEGILAQTPTTNASAGVGPTAEGGPAPHSEEDLAEAGWDAQSAWRDGLDQPTEEPKPPNPLESVTALSQQSQSDPTRLSDLIANLEVVDELDEVELGRVARSLEGLMGKVSNHLAAGVWAGGNGYDDGLESDIQGDLNELERQLRPLSGRPAKSVVVLSYVTRLADYVLEVAQRSMTEAASTRMQQLRESALATIGALDGAANDPASALRAVDELAFCTSWNQVEPSDDTTIDEWLRFVEQAERNKAATAGRALAWLPESRAEVVGGSLGGFGAGGTVTGLATAIAQWVGFGTQEAGGLGVAGGAVGIAVGAVLGVLAVRYKTESEAGARDPGRPTLGRSFGS